MKRSCTVLVTGVGAIIGYGIIKTLRASGRRHTIVGIDIFPDAVGRHWCDAFVRGVRAEDPGFMDFLDDVVRAHGVDLVIPGIEQDVWRLNQERHRLPELETAFALNADTLIRCAHDKWAMHQVLQSRGLPVIPSVVEGDWEQVRQVLGEPLLMKLRTSYSSKGMQVIHDRYEYEFWKRKAGADFMAQRLVGSDDEEYTTSVFGYGDGTSSRTISLQRTLSGEGATAKAKVVEVAEIDARVLELCAIFEPVGPTNFQFRRHHGDYLLLEINPRISSATSLRAAFGFNEAAMCIEHYLEGARPDAASIRRGTASRFIDEIVTLAGDPL